MNLNKLFRPKKLAIIGGYWADFVYDENIKIGFKGEIWHINPKRKSSKKKKYYKSIADLPSIPDCVYVAVSNDLTIKPPKLKHKAPIKINSVPGNLFKNVNLSLLYF